MNIEDQGQEKFVTSDTLMEMISQDSLTDDTVMRTSDSEDGENMSQTITHAAGGKRENMESILLP
eukprot:gene11585-12778_t